MRKYDKNGMEFMVVAEVEDVYIREECLFLLIMRLYGKNM